MATWTPPKYTKNLLSKTPETFQALFIKTGRFYQEPKTNANVTSYACSKKSNNDIELSWLLKYI